MKLVVANLKMNKTKEEMIIYKKTLEENIENNNLIICPQDIYLDFMISQNYKVGAQDLYIENSGSYTGENSPDALESIGVTYGIVGHSERRKHFNETNDFINKKIKAALTNNIIPILCIGESLEERELKEEILKKQLEECLKEITGEIIIAYEPIWAIGTGKLPTTKEITEVISFIKTISKNKVIYGGSINLENIEEIINLENIDGVLIGGASLNPNNLINIFNKC